MPSDASVNLRTSAAAALCARFLSHPYTPLPANVHSSASSLPLENSSWPSRKHTAAFPSHSSTSPPSHSFSRPTTPPSMDWPARPPHFISCFHLHHFENHLISGMMAKVAGTILWAPMAKLNSLQSHHCSQDPFSFKDAVRLAKQVCRSSTSGGGVLSLWSEYTATLRALLPYTMLYFAVYEQLKQLARGYLCVKQDQAGEFRNSTSASQRGHRPPTDSTPSPLGLGTYMSCVAGAVAISSTVCHTASALTNQLKELFHSYRTPSTPSSSAMGVMHHNTSSSPAALHSNTASPTTRTAYQYRHPHERDNNHHHPVRKYDDDYIKFYDKRIYSAHDGNTSHDCTRFSTTFDQQRA
ncbi:unnamed protein product [Mortierella alpina]